MVVVLLIAIPMAMVHLTAVMIARLILLKLLQELVVVVILIQILITMASRTASISAHTTATSAQVAFVVAAHSIPILIMTELLIVTTIAHKILISYVQDNVAVVVKMLMVIMMALLHVMIHVMMIQTRLNH